MGDSINEQKIQEVREREGQEKKEVCNMNMNISLVFFMGFPLCKTSKLLIQLISQEPPHYITKL